MKRLIPLAIAALLALSCAENTGKKETIVLSGEMDVILQTGRWNYISLEEEKVVGVSELGDTEADAAWGARTDWDIAVCDSLLKSNGGASGKGRGSISGLEDTPQEIW